MPFLLADIDENTTLCFACSSSLPSPKKSPGTFTTPCCQRLICPNCILTNPRLLRYNPCLACLGGVGVVGSASHRGARTPNVDGALRDEDMFALGDDDESDSENEKEEDPTATGDALSSITGTPHLIVESASKSLPPKSESARGLKEEETPAVKGDINNESSPLKYYISQSDTLQGIVLRYGLDGHKLCQLNNLPSSTLRTTPHLLHTRRFLILPPSARKLGVPVDGETPKEAKEREANRTKERAEKRLQTMTKEVDWRVAKAYVALADDPEEEAEEQEALDRKRKELGGKGRSAGPSNIEERAIRRYLDDEEWEESQRRAGNPTGSGGQDRTQKAGGRRWWQ